MNEQKRGRQTPASKEEAAQRAAEMRTQGRQGCKMPRICIALTPDNSEYAHISARATGQPVSKFINLCIAEHRKAHPEILEMARAILAAAAGDQDQAAEDANQNEQEV